jgi:hypothetical protein
MFRNCITCGTIETKKVVVSKNANKEAQKAEYRKSIHVNTSIEALNACSIHVRVDYILVIQRL